jgi:UDP-glucose:(heptosyl)LPS alpha-1,3-glucosyltransferase
MDPWIKRLSHPVNPLHRSLLFLEKRLFQSARLKKIMANSQRGKEDIIRHYDVPPEKIEVIYNGVDLDVFHPRNVALYRNPLRQELRIDPEAFVILFLGSGFWRKGLDSLITSFAKVKREIPQATLIVAGKDRIQEYREKARRLGVENGILFLGPTHRAKELCAASDLFALPTVYDPFSNACLEAMATGIPVLTTLQNGIAELIRDGENGFLISEPKDWRQIGEKIIAHSHSDKKEEIGQRARESCLPLDMNLVIGRMLRVYESVQ